jgi:hypothetical protein
VINVYFLERIVKAEESNTPTALGYNVTGVTGTVKWWPKNLFDLLYTKDFTDSAILGLGKLGKGEPKNADTKTSETARTE